MPNSVVVIDKKSDWTPWIVAGGVAAAGVGLYLWTQSKKQEEGVPSGLKVTSYKNLRTVVTVNAPGVLKVERGDGVRVSFQWSYKGEALSGSYHVAFARKELGVINEVGTPVEIPFTIPESPDSRLVTGQVDLLVAGIDIWVGDLDGLYVKIYDIPGANIDYFLPGVIKVEEIVEPAFSDLEIIGVTSPVVVGGTCQVTCRWMYQGPATTRVLYAAIGIDGFFGFTEKLHSQVTISLPASTVPVERASAVIIPITTAINPAGSPYDVYAKIGTGGLNWDIESPHLQNVVTVTPRYVSFLMSINADSAVAAFPGADRWRADYWDPRAQRFVGDGKLYYLSGILGIPGNDIAFENVAPGGYLAVFLYDIDGGAYSEQFTSEEWTAQHGYDYEFDPLSGQIYEI